jgi:hypothetical protein
MLVLQLPNNRWVGSSNGGIPVEEPHGGSQSCLLEPDCRLAETSHAEASLFGHGILGGGLCLV